MWGKGVNDKQADELGYRALAAGYESTDVCLGFRGVRRWQLSDRADFVPDFRDPATLGILLAQVRAAWDSPNVYVKPPGTEFDDWTARSPHQFVVPFYGINEATALVLALEGSP